MKNISKNEQKVGMLLQKRTDTRGVGISSMRKSIYIPPYNHTHRFHPLPLATCIHLLTTTPIHSIHSPQLSTILYLCKVQSMDDNCGEWVECMGVASGSGCKEVYRFPNTTYPYSSCIRSFFAAASLLFVHFLKCFSFSNYIDFLILLTPIIILLLYVLFFAAIALLFVPFLFFYNYIC